MKICRKCEIEKENSEFYRKEKMSNRLDSVCKKCKNNLTTENRRNDTEYRKKHLEHSKRYRENNIEKVKDSKKRYYQDNKEIILKKNSSYQKEYLSIEDNRIKRNKKINIRFKERIKIDPLFSISTIIRNLIKYSLKVNNHVKSHKTEEILGCSFDEFKIYIESKFENWMTWDNRGLYNGQFNFGWDIDHIIPLSSAKCEEDVIKLNHYSNLQPLCSKINRDIKKDKIL